MYTGSRPKCSEMGAFSIGPKASASVYRLSLSTAASVDTPKASANVSVAGEYPEAPKLTQRSMGMMGSHASSFRHCGL